MSDQPKDLPEPLKQHEPVVVSLDVVWSGSTLSRMPMSEISMVGCFIHSRVQGRTIGDTVEFKVHLPTGPWANWSNPMGFELRFIKLTDKRLLAQVVLAHGGNPGCTTRRLPLR